MTQEEKAYDRLIERLKDLKFAYRFSPLSDTIEEIFPELKESEDEKIRKTLYGWVCVEPDDTFKEGFTKEQILAWLEKKGEQKTTWDKQDEENMNNVLYILNQLKDTSSYKEHDIAEKTINWFKALKYRLCSNNEYGKDMLGAIEYCIKNHRPLEKEHIAWLEKQGEQQYFNDNLLSFDEAQETVIVEKQHEQKPINEHKFNTGDWITRGEHYTYKIIAVGQGLYVVNKNNEEEVSLSFKYVEKYFHLWTIQDVKDGDVVVDKSDGTIGIFQSIGHHPDGGSYNDHSYCFLHCRYDDGFFYADFEQGNTIDSDDLIPATIEQRDQLEKAMANAGYFFDFGKKELEKIEQKPTEDVNLPEFERCLCLMLQKFRTKGMCTNGEIIDYVKEYTQRLRNILVKPVGFNIGDEITVNGQVGAVAVDNPAWSEEDEEILNSFLHKLEVCDLLSNKEGIWIKNKLKSLKPQSQLKPSDEQMKALDIAIRCGTQLGTWEEDALESLKEQLKKLREE